MVPPSDAHPVAPLARRRARRRAPGEGTIYFDNGRNRFEGQLFVVSADGRRQRRKVTGRSEEEVRAKLRRLAVDAESRRLVSNKNTTVAKFLAEWADTVLPEAVAPSTAVQYRDVIRLYITPRIGSKRLASLAAADVTRMVNDLSASGLSPNTVRSARSVLRRALRYAVHDELVTANAAQNSFGVRVPQRAGRTMTVEQARTFLSSIEGHRLEAAWVTALSLGLRLGELLGLEWSDLELDPPNAVIRVSGAVKRLPGAGLVRSETKTRTSRRTVHVPGQVVAVLRSHRARQLEERLRAGDEWTNLPLGADLVFRTEFGTALDPANFRHYTYAATEKAGIGRWTPHELRHSAASLLIAMGVPLKVISETLGHSSIRVTADVYGHLLDDARAQAAAAMSRALWEA